jgi:hypothetical protein
VRCGACGVGDSTSMGLKWCKKLVYNLLFMRGALVVRNLNSA